MPHRIAPRLGLPALLTLLPPGAEAAGRPPAQPPGAVAPGAVDPARQRAALAPTESTAMRGTMEATLRAMRGPMVAQIQLQGMRDEAEAAAAFDDILMPALRQGMPAMPAGTAAIRARHLTVGEIEALGDFCRTPAGRKMPGLTPAVTAETTTMAQALPPRLVQDAIVRNREALRARGLDL